MRKGKSVIGQPVYTVSDGRKLDSVKDLVLEEGEDGVVALLVSEGGLPPMVKRARWMTSPSPRAISRPSASGSAKAAC